MEGESVSCPGISRISREIVELQLEPMTGLALADAIRQRATVSCLVIAR